ncbi:hypothetical protein [Sneathiella sp.]|uniref:hypothetical protein n=1 Tax=Sneathiella sp. TaxID=1964365 RepID=UPI0026343A22|nr:hypothetical protein [Sneathiella sp.]MDF2367502.1 hypothetical protein [Sneathiella sp.]
MVERREIITEARRWIGTPWRHQGRSRSGVDCVGLVVLVARALGLEPEDVAGYARRRDGRALLRHLHNQLQSQSLTNWKIGYIGVFKESAFPIHVGFLSARDGVPTVIHAHARRRQVIEEALVPYGAPFAVFSFPEVL